MDKYSPLQKFLEAESPVVEVRLSMDTISTMVGGLPLSATIRREWWANNSASHAQAKSWMDAGRLVSKVQLGEWVVFSPVTASANRKSDLSKSGSLNRIDNSPWLLDGVAALDEVLKRGGFESILEAVAAHTIFLDAHTVAQTNGKALFPVVRDPNRPGAIDPVKEVMFDNNTSPTRTFEWAAKASKSRDVQFNHVWADAKNKDTYTALWNLCVTPAFLAKTTDGSNHPEVVEALRYRSFDLYGYLPSGATVPKRPLSYDLLNWKESPPAVEDLESVIRNRLVHSPKSVPAKSARELGWLFSNGVPDSSI